MKIVKLPTLLCAITGLFALLGCSNNQSSPEAEDVPIPDPDTTPMSVSPDIVEVDITDGADFIVNTGVDSYIYWAFYSEPAYCNPTYTYVKDIFDGSFTEYKDNLIHIEQLSATEYHIVILPQTSFEGESCSWTLYFLPAYVTSRNHGLVDGSLTIIYEKL